MHWEVGSSIPMTELEKYLIATVVLFFWIGAIAVLAQLIPQMIEKALPL